MYNNKLRSKKHFADTLNILNRLTKHVYQSSFADKISMLYKTLRDLRHEMFYITFT
ncbi:hypothetical protein PNC201_06415 [Pseudoalteromonas sp. NC201]|nr:hypothetical protein PNC201_06415 [Pseudoalteromonas sp. NC201]